MLQATTSLTIARNDVPIQLDASTEREFNENAGTVSIRYAYDLSGIDNPRKSSVAYKVVAFKAKDDDVREQANSDDDFVLVSGKVISI